MCTNNCRSSGSLRSFSLSNLSCSSCSSYMPFSSPRSSARVVSSPRVSLNPKAAVANIEGARPAMSEGLTRWWNMSSSSFSTCVSYTSLLSLADFHETSDSDEHWPTVSYTLPMLSLATWFALRISLTDSYRSFWRYRY